MATPRKREEDKLPSGRPQIVLSNEQIVQIEALAAYLSIEQIADYIGVGKTTFYELMDRQPEISERYKRGKAKAIGSVAQSLIQKAQAGDNTCMVFYLKTQARWTEEVKVDHTSSDGSMATVGSETLNKLAKKYGD
jgi:IS30 family transposase